MDTSPDTQRPGFFARLKRLFNPKNDLSVSDDKAWNPWLWNLLGAQSDSGINVDPQTALNYSAVFNAVYLLSVTTSTLPLRLLKQAGKSKKPASNKSVFQVMHTKWNPYMTAQIGREVLHSHILTWGNGYAEIVANKMGEVLELWPIPPNRVTPEMKDNELVYRIQVDGREIYYPREKILHVPGLGFDGFVGYSIVGLARQSIGLGMATEKFGSSFFGNGTHPGVIVSHPGKLGETAGRNLRESLVEKYSGLGNSHRLLLLEEGMKMEKVGIPPNDAQFLETRQFQIPEIARWFNLPPHKLKDLTKSSFNNIEQEQISFVTDSVQPWCIRLETNFNMQLLTLREQQQGHYFKHNMEGLLRGDSASRAEYYSKLFNIGSMSQNDIRSKEDLDPIEGGDRYYVPMNMVPTDKVDEVMDNANTPPETIEENDEQDEQSQGNEQEGQSRGNVIPI